MQTGWIMQWKTKDWRVALYQWQPKRIIVSHERLNLCPSDVHTS
jgi:hypothetical protein